jgi:Phosphotransferase enzyme family
VNTVAHIRPAVTMPGKEETYCLREKIASALNNSVDAVRVNRWHPNESCSNLYCWGSSNGGPFFAKILQSDRYPISTVSPLALEMFGPRQQIRSAEDQVEFEWKMTTEMRAIGGSNYIPAPLGRSRTAKTIVWEQARGTPVGDLLKYSAWRDPRGSRGTAALFRAGAWLRKIHKAVPQGHTTVDFHKLVDLLPELAQKQEALSSRYVGIIRKVLKAALASVGGSGAFSVPVGLIHGDFKLDHLIRNNKTSELFIVDFGRSGQGNISHDLSEMVYCIKAKLLNPFIPKHLVSLWEKSFWAGYGSVPKEIKVLVDAQAIFDIFSFALPQLSARARQQGWPAHAIISVYKIFLEQQIVWRRLGVTDAP